MSLLPVGIGASGDDYTIDDSLRFRQSAAAYLSRTFTTPTDGKKWTYSVWVKRAKAPTVLGYGTNHLICTAGSGAQGNFGWGWNNADDIALTFGGYGRRYTTGLFRDPSAWYHIVLKIDTTQATEANRALLYVNGALFPWNTNTSISQNSTTQINQAVAHNIGRQTGQPYQSFDGYMTEINFIDGQALTADDFGEYDDNGTWKAKEYEGTYGTNGFYLNGVGVTDQSGNGNNWTNNNLNLSTSTATTYDQMKDTPSLVDENAANFATLNPLDAYPGREFAVDGNLKWNDTSGGSWGRSTLSVTTGKWYWEVSGFTTTNWFIGVSDGTKSITNYYAYYVGAPTALVYLINGNTYIAGANAAFVSAFATTDIVGFVVDADAGSLAVYKNNTLQGTITGLSYGSYSPMVAPPAVGSCVYNFGQRPFAYTPPTGSKKLNTFNLPDSTIEDGSDYFNTVTFSANGSAASVTGVGFQPDFIWAKNRTNAYNHELWDAVRGVNSELQSNSNAGEITTTNRLVSFDSDGFSYGTSSNLYVNGTNSVAWNWLANGSGVSNTVGDITSTVSANTTAGFSIVSYAGNNGSNQTVGHGLGVTPSMFIIKNRTNASGWPVYHKDISNPLSNAMYLQSTNAAFSWAYWGTGGLSSTVFPVHYGSSDSTNQSGKNYIAYVFAEVEGYSSFGSYTGNGSTNGAFVYTGFRPAFLVIKKATGTVNANAGWMLKDATRDVDNVANANLQAESAGAEYTSNTEDFLSNGFKIRTNNIGQNTSGSTYIYMAFAENPFKNALAR